MELIDLTINSARYDGFLGVYGVYIYIYFSLFRTATLEGMHQPLGPHSNGTFLFFSWEPVQGWPFRSVPGARISVRSVPFRSAAFHVVWKPACKDVTCV